MNNKKKTKKWDVIPIDNSRGLEKEMAVTLGQDSKVNIINIPHRNHQNQQNIDLPGLGNPLNLKNILEPHVENEREMKGIYYDDELHTMLIYLIFSLIITPQKGSLDPLYCSRKPIEDGKPPVLYYLHFHLNHPNNQPLIPMIYKKVSYFCKFRLMVNSDKIQEFAC